MANRSFLVVAAALLILTGSAFADTQPSDLYVELILPKSTFGVGEKVEYELKVTNVSCKDVSVVIGGTPMAGHRIEVRDTSGKLTPFKHRLSGEFHRTIFSQNVAPGCSSTLKQPINQWAVITRPGTYVAIASTRPSNEIGVVARDSVSAPVTFTVVASTEKSRDERFNAAMLAVSQADQGWKKQQAVDDLGYTLDPRAVPELLKLARDPKTEYRALTSLFMFDSRQARDAVLADLIVNGTMGHATGDVMKVFHISYEQMGQTAERWLQNGGVEQRVNALVSLPAVGSARLTESARNYVHGLLRDPQRQIRAAAVSLMWDTNYGATYDEIAKMAETDPSPYVRGRAASTLLTFRDQTERTVVVLERLLYSPYKGLVETIGFLLRSTRLPSAKTVLEQGARSNNADVKAVCEQQLKEWSPQ